MSEPREVRCYEYVNRPYEHVRDALGADATGLFRRATAAAASRAHSLASLLRVELGAVQLSAAIDVSVEPLEESTAPGQVTRRSKLRFTWRATHNAGLFPTMDALLAIYPLSPQETQLDLQGSYRPPLGAIGSAVDALVGHRIAEASVLRFLQDVVEQLRIEVGGAEA